MPGGAPKHSKMGIARMNWTDEQRTFLHVLRSRFNFDRDTNAAVFNTVFADEVAACGYTDGGIPAYHVHYQYDARYGRGRPEKKWRGICSNNQSAEEMQRRGEMEELIHETLFALGVEDADLDEDLESEEEEAEAEEESQFDSQDSQDDGEESENNREETENSDDALMDEGEEEDDDKSESLSDYPASDSPTPQDKGKQRATDISQLEPGMQFPMSIPVDDDYYIDEDGQEYPGEVKDPPFGKPPLSKTAPPRTVGQLSSPLLPKPIRIQRGWEPDPNWLSYNEWLRRQEAVMQEGAQRHPAIYQAFRNLVDGAERAKKQLDDLWDLVKDASSDEEDDGDLVMDDFEYVD